MPNLFVNGLHTSVSDRTTSITFEWTVMGMLTLRKGSWERPSTAGVHVLPDGKARDSGHSAASRAEPPTEDGHAAAILHQLCETGALGSLCF